MIQYQSLLNCFIKNPFFFFDYFDIVSISEVSLVFYWAGLVILQLAVKSDRHMESLLDNMTAFISTIIDLYPLPSELNADLLTLNSYLKSYNKNEDHLLTNFVKRQVQKLKSKTDRESLEEYNENLMPDPAMISQKEEKNESGDNFDFRLNLKVDSPMELSQLQLGSSKSVLDRSEIPLSYRSGKSKESEGIKSARHKFGTRERNRTQKTMDKGTNKENIHSFANLRITQRSTKELKLEERSLKFIKSEAQLLRSNNQTLLMRQNSTQTRKEQPKLKIRYQSNQPRSQPTNSSLKIKLKPKASFDIGKSLEGIFQLIQDMQNQQVTISMWMQKINSEDLETEN